MARLRRALLVVGALLAAASPAAAAERLSTIRGTVAAPTGSAAGRLLPTVRVLRLAPAYGAVPVLLTGRRYRVAVPPGVYAVVATTWRGTRQVRTVSVLVAAGGKIRGAAGPATRDPLPDEYPISVAEVRQAPFGDVSPSFEGDVISRFGEATCENWVVEDRSSPVFREVLAEVRLRATEAIRPEDRRELSDAAAILQAWRPRYRLTGTVHAGEAGTGPASGSFRLVTLPGRQVVWSHDYAVPEGGLAALSREVSLGVLLVTCRMPEALRLTTHASERYPGTTVRTDSYDATIDLAFSAYRRYAGGVTVFTYQPTAVTATWHGDVVLPLGSVTCTGSLDAAGPWTPQGLVSLRAWFRRPRHYSLLAAFTAASTGETPVPLACSDGSAATFPVVPFGNYYVPDGPYGGLPVDGSLVEEAPPDGYTHASWTLAAVDR